MSSILLRTLIFLSSALAFTACTDPAAPSTEVASATDSVTTTPDTARPYLPGLLSTPEHDEGGLHFTPHGEVYFWRRLPGEKQRIYVFRPDQPDVAPKPVSFSTDRDENAFLTRDGLTAYFGSERPIPGRPNLGNFDMNVWVTTRPDLSSPWAAPRPLPPSFNAVQGEGENWPVANTSGVFSLDDSTYYVNTQMPGDTATRLYRYRRTADNNLVDPERIDGLFADPRYSIGGPALTPDGRYLFFSSYGAPGGAGGEDLYVSRRRPDGTYAPARPLTQVNTDHEEAGPYVSPDGQTLYFGKAYAINPKEWVYDVWNIYSIPIASLNLEDL